MPLRTLDGMSAPRPEDLEEFSIWIHEDTAREADAPEPGEDPDEGLEEIKIFTRALSGYELERVGNADGLKKKGRRGNQPQPSNDGTMSMEQLAKIIVRIEPMPVKPDGTPWEKISTDCVRGFPDWFIMRVTDHIKWVRRKAAEEAKN